MPNSFYTFIKKTISKNILKIAFLNKPEFVFFLHTGKWYHLISNNSVKHKYYLLFTHLVIGLKSFFCLYTVRYQNSSILNNSV